MVKGAGRLVACLAVFSATAVFADTLPTLKISPSVAVKYQKFQKLGIPGYMAVSPHGTVSDFGFCRDKNPEKCDSAARKLALDFCQKANEGTPCVLFADQAKTLYAGKIDFPHEDDIQLVTQGWSPFRTEMSWEGQFEQSKSWMLLSAGEKPQGWLKLLASEEHRACFGAYSVQTRTKGSWVMSCGAKLQATGEYAFTNGSWTSRGKDANGKTVIIRSFIK